MKTCFKAFLATIVIILYSCSPIEGKSPKNVPDNVRVVYVEVDKKVEWDKLIEAIIQIESEGNDKAFNKKSNAAGCLQQTPIYVKEVNRILGEKKYTLNDRYNRTKAIEMFNIYQNEHNPNKDFHLALKLHNPKSKYSYHFAIEKKYNELIGK